MRRFMPQKAVAISTGSFRLLMASFLTAQPAPRQKIDVSKLGPQVGDRVPDFSLADQNGKTWALPSIITVSGTKISTAHLEITSYPSSPEIVPGDRFSLVLDVTPHPKMHVYAPGAKSYRVVSLAIEPNPEFRVLSLQYPPSENYLFKPLNERVAVFRKPFRLVQEVVLEGTPQAQAALRGKEDVSIKGALDYQACNDRECFTPDSVPLSWTLKLQPLVIQRPGQQKQ